MASSQEKEYKFGITFCQVSTLEDVRKSDFLQGGKKWSKNNADTSINSANRINTVLRKY